MLKGEKNNMKDFEIIKLNAADEFHSFFNEQEKKDRWINVYTNELFTTPLENNELALYTPGSFAIELPNGVQIEGFADDVTNDEIQSSMTTTKTSVVLPMENKFQMYPLRYTAWTHLQKRAGLEGRAINSTRDRLRAKELAPAKRCTMFNETLPLYSDMTKVLIRDGKITALMSGDEADYAVMPVSRLILTLENELLAQYENFEFHGATTNHEITQIVYSLHDESLERSILNILSSNGALIGKVSVNVQLTTSDTGNCAARLTPIIRVDDHVMPIGKPDAVEHKGGSKAMTAFIDMAHRFLGKYRENIEVLQRLMDVKISYPSSCLQNIVNKINLVGYGKSLRNAKEKLDQEFTSCTAYDIYWTLNDMLFEAEETAKAENKTINLYSSIKDQETIGSCLFLNFKEFDY